MPQLPSAIRALLEAREAHAERAVEEFRAEIGKPPFRVRLDLETAYGVKAGPGASDSDACEKARRSLQAPLGWYVSYGAAKTIAASAQSGLDQLMPALAIGRKQTLAPIMPPK